MVKALLVQGMLAGLLAGLLAFGCAWFFGEPQIDLAIGFERYMHVAAGEAPEPELVSRAVQSTAGLLTGILVYSSALGGIFSLVFAYAYGRLGRMSPRATAAMLAIFGYVALILIPQLKYPANPPAVGEQDTIAARTTLYFTMIALSVTVSVAATLSARKLARRLGVWNGALVGGVLYLISIAAAMFVLPPINEVPVDFPATTLWNFRLDSLGVELVLWTALGLIFGLFAEQQLRPAFKDRPAGRGLARAP
jgi:magnesium-transporting ATPase (P-type)